MKKIQYKPEIELSDENVKPFKTSQDMVLHSGLSSNLFLTSKVKTPAANL